MTPSLQNQRMRANGPRGASFISCTQARIVSTGGGGAGAAGGAGGEDAPTSAGARMRDASALMLIVYGRRHFEAKPEPGLRIVGQAAVGLYLLLEQLVAKRCGLCRPHHDLLDRDADDAEVPALEE